MWYGFRQSSGIYFLYPKNEIYLSMKTKMIQQYNCKRNHHFSADFTSSLFSCLNLLNISNFLFKKCLLLKSFKSQNFFFKKKVASTTFGSSVYDWHYILFYIRCCLFIIHFPQLFRNFSVANVLFSGNLLRGLWNVL